MLRAILVSALLLFSCASRPRPVTLAATIENDRVLVPVSVNGSAPRLFLLDTGASQSVLNADRLGELRLRGEGSGKATVQGGTVETSGVPAVTLSLGDFELPAQTLAAISLRGVEAGVARKIYGIVGGELFRRVDVTIDYAAARVILGATPPRNGVSIPIAIEENTPIVTARIVSGEEAAEGRFQIDTGGGLLTLNEPFLAAHPRLVPAKTLQVTAGAILPNQSRGGVGRAAMLELGPLRIANPIANFSQNPSGDRVDVDAGLIGGDILRRFTLTFDYEHRRVLFEPNAALAEPFEFSMAGASIAAEGDDFRTLRVRSVVRDTPAAEAGLRAGDRIVRIDGREVTLREVRALFAIEGRTYAIDVDRAGERVALRLTTRRLI